MRCQPLEPFHGVVQGPAFVGVDPQPADRSSSRTASSIARSSSRPILTLSTSKSPASRTFAATTSGVSMPMVNEVTGVRPRIDAQELLERRSQALAREIAERHVDRRLGRRLAFDGHPAAAVSKARGSSRRRPSPRPPRRRIASPGRSGRSVPPRPARPGRPAPTRRSGCCARRSRRGPAGRCAGARDRAVGDAGWRSTHHHSCHPAASPRPRPTDRSANRVGKICRPLIAATTLCRLSKTPETIVPDDRSDNRPRSTPFGIPRRSPPSEHPIGRTNRENT